jgi:hypothetical protein
MIEITIDTHGLLDGLAKIPVELKKALRAEMKDQLQNVQRTARKEHRHSHKWGAIYRQVRGQDVLTRQYKILRSYKLTGKLNESVTVAIDPSGMIGEVGLDLQKAYYGPYVHEGWTNSKTGAHWAPDKFLDAALLKQEPKLRVGLENALRSGLQAAGAL